MLHDSIVNAFRTASFKRHGLGPHKCGSQCLGHARLTRRTRLLCRSRHGGFTRFQNIGGMRFKCFKQSAYRHQENTCIPKHTALQQQFLRFAGIGLFNKTLHRTAAILALSALLNVAIGRAGKSRHHAKGHDGPLLGSLHTLLHRIDKGLSVWNVMVCRTKQKQAIRTCRWLNCQSCQGHGRSRVSANGL